MATTTVSMYEKIVGLKKVIVKVNTGQGDCLIGYFNPTNAEEFFGIDSENLEALVVAEMKDELVVYELPKQNVKKTYLTRQERRLFDDLMVRLQRAVEIQQGLLLAQAFEHVGELNS